MNDDSRDGSRAVRLRPGDLLAVMLFGAVFGVTAFGVAAFVVDAIRDKLGLHMSPLLLAIFAAGIVSAMGATVLLCWLFTRLAMRLGEPGRSVSDLESGGAVWALREPPSSVTEQTTLHMEAPKRRS